MDTGPIIAVVDGARVVVVSQLASSKDSIPEFVAAKEDELVCPGVILSQFKLVVHVLALAPCFAVARKTRSSSHSRRSCPVLSSRYTHAAIVFIAIDKGPVLVAVVEQFTFFER